MYTVFLFPLVSNERENKLETNEKLVISIEAAIFAVLAFLMALLPLNVGLFDVEAGMIPIIILSFRRGWKTGLLSGFFWGFIKLASGNITMLSVLQVFIEYVFAFAVSGLAGILWLKIKETVSKEQWKRAFGLMAASISFAVIVKYFIHFVAGVVYWHIYAPESMNPVAYSLFVNGISAILTGIVTISVSSFVVYKAPQLINTDK